jgi:hypothetical protein
MEIDVRSRPAACNHDFQKIRQYDSWHLCRQYRAATGQQIYALLSLNPHLRRPVRGPPSRNSRQKMCNPSLIVRTPASRIVNWDDLYSNTDQSGYKIPRGYRPAGEISRTMHYSRQAPFPMNRKKAADETKHPKLRRGFEYQSALVKPPLLKGIHGPALSKSPDRESSPP